MSTAGGAKMRAQPRMWIVARQSAIIEVCVRYTADARESETDCQASRNPAAPFKIVTVIVVLDPGIEGNTIRNVSEWP